MAQKHLSLFYSYKFVPEKFRVSFPILEKSEEALEKQVQRRLAQGHQQFFQGRYPEALQEYQAAYALVFKFLHPDFPDKVISLDPSLVHGFKVFDALLAASGAVARYRQAVGDRGLIISPEGPPEEVVSLVEQFGGVGAGERPSLARVYYRQAAHYLRIGAAGQAQVFLDRAKEANQGQDQRLEADLLAAGGVAAILQQNPDQAQAAFKNAQGLYSHLRLSGEAAAVQNNLGVLSNLMGDPRAAGAAFQAAGDHLPLGLGRSLAQPLNPGTATTMTRPMGQEGLGLLLSTPDVERGWMAVSPTTVPVDPSAQRLGVFLDAQVIDIDLQADPAAELVKKVYKPRIGATTLEQLSTYEHLEYNLVAYLAHLHAFTLPLSIGDCYFEMGDYEQALAWYLQARDYEFLNQTIEAPVVWVKMTSAYLQWGNFLYKNHEKAEARVRYEQIVRLTDPVLDPASPLYASPVFDGLKAQVEAILAAPTPPDGEVHNPAVALPVLLAQLNLQNLESGIDLPLLSLEREDVPVFTFEYLQNVARYFAEHAIQAERTYINFKTNAEQEAFTRSMLENAVDLERANEILEEKKVDIAGAQKAAVDANAAYAQMQLQNARDLKTEYASVSLQENALDAEITYVGAPTTEYDFSGYEQYGISDGSHRADEVLRTLTSRRREISREFELHNMDRRISELEAAGNVAQKQQVIANLQVQSANIQRDIAALRRQQAEGQLALFDSREFTPDLWNRLANEIKAISQSYLEQAIVIARLMEQAFEFEIGETVDVIKPGYTRNDLSGLLGGDFLLRDIDSFTFLRIIHSRKKQPMKEIISLADRYPVQFLREFQRTGRMNFRTELSDFDHSYPGAYQQRIKRVEVVVEGLIGHEGIHGTLTNTGLCLTRMRNNDIQMRLLEPETLLLSRYRIGQDSVVFVPDGEMLAVFENSPVSTSWVLELRPSANDLIYSFLTDVKLILYYETFYDEGLRSLVLEELAETQAITGRRAVALRYELFDEFFTFQDTGKVSFTLRNTMLPFYHTDPRVREMTLLVQTDEGVSPAGLVIQAAVAEGTEVAQATDADGAVSSGPGAAFNAFISKALLQEWTIAIPQAPNQARFDGGFQWSQVNNLVLVAEYEFTPRRIPGEPYLLLRDGFDRDPQAAFDRVDDPQATQGPSSWVYNAAEGRVEQQAAIAGGANDNGPEKPGTYFVRKTGGVLPAVRDLILTCRMRSENDGGIGLVFRWQNADNFYFFLMDSQRKYRRIGKKVGGVFQELNSPAIDPAQGFLVGQTYLAKVRAQRDGLQVYLDGDLILSGSDSSLPDAGRVGFFSWKNTGAQFDDLQVIEL